MLPEIYARAVRAQERRDVVSTAARPTPRRAILVAACTIVALACSAIVAAHANAATGPYLALGDSYTAGPLVPTPTGSPILCGRSTNDYPADVARAITPPTLIT